jgi:AbrB family looped-hinge helix DNA binding protein
LIFRRIWKNRSELGRGVAADVVWTAVKQYAKRIGVDHHIQGITPCRASNRCTPQVDASGRIALPAEARQRNGIAEGDAVIITEGAEGLHIKTRHKVLADAQAYFARLAPASVSLSEESLKDRRSEAERD